METRLIVKLHKLIDQMARETARELRTMHDDVMPDTAMDASIASQAAIVMASLSTKFDAMFKRVAKPLAREWMTQVSDNNAAGMSESLKEIAGHMTLKTDILGGELNDIFQAGVAGGVGLISTVPGEFLDGIKGDVMRSIQNGENLEKLLDQFVDKGKVKTKNWARNVAMDQTRKAYNSLARGRMEKVGVTSYEWVHSGGSNHPRKLHQHVLNGKIFTFADPPIIQEQKGKTPEVRGIPGQLPYCRCIMRPVMVFDDE